jgi:hypothetical protein
MEMNNNVWISSYCIQTEGFPKLLYTTMQSLGIRERPEYEGREYEEHGTERCEVTIYIGKSEDYPNIAEEWSTTATGFRFTDTYQAVARKALRRLCKIYKEPISRTPMKFFPPEEKNNPAWIARLEALQGQETDPATRHLTDYLLALDEQYDRQATALRTQIRRAEEAELHTRTLHVQYAQAQARAASAESRETTIAEFLKTIIDQHAEELKRAYLITRPRRRMFAMHGNEPVILEGHPIHPPERRRMDIAVPPAPPPSRDFDAEPLLPLTQSPPKEEGHCSTTVDGPAEPRNEAVQSDEVE